MAWHGGRLTVALCLAATGAAAQGPAPAPAPAAGQTVEVRGRRAGDTSVEPGGTLRGERLSSRVESTLGATLQSELGTANASFGPNVGLPLVRGQGGSRVRALVGGLGTHDASTVSADHGVMVEPALAESITVWRGPATIRFGGGAIGGAVEIEEGRLPQQRRDQLDAKGSLRVGSGESGVAVLRLDGPITGLPAGPGLVWHADVHARRQGLTRIRGAAIDDEAVRSQFQRVNTINTVGYIDNTRATTQGGALGVGAVGDTGFVGLSLSRLRQNYGIPPGGHSHSHPVAPGEPPSSAGDAVRIQAQQDRLDLRAETVLPAGSWPRGEGRPVLRLRAARVLYAHDETEGGRLSTTFSNVVSEGRAEVEQRWNGNLSSTWGLQAQQREFAALGEEAFVPRTAIRGGAVLALQRWQAAPWLLELGLRAEWQRYTPAAGFNVLGVPREFPPRHFWPRSASLALQRSYGAAEGSGGGGAGGSVTLTHWQVGRAPDVQELYAAGPHLATRTFDFGNSALGLESLHAWDVAWAHRQGPWQWRGNAFAYRSRNYIYQRSLGWFYEMEEQQPQAVCAKLDACLPATKREQSPAHFFGYEAELAHESKHEQGRLRMAVFSDLVRGRLEQGGGVPRLPPQRYGVGVEATAGPWSAQARLTRGRAQTRPGDNETRTAGWTRLDAGLRFTRAAEHAPLSFFLLGRNLGNRAIRNSTSFLRNYAPEPGRSIEAGLEWAL